MLACVDDYDYDGYAVVLLILMLLVMLMLVMMLTMAHRLPANDRSSLTVTHSLTFVTAAQAEVGLLAETTYVRSLIHIPINLNSICSLCKTQMLIVVKTADLCT